MGKLRAANGHPEPYGVKFWGVGNEAWGDWQLGAMSLKQFEIKNNLFAEAMRKCRPDDQTDRQRCDAGRHDRLQTIQAHQRQAHSRSARAGRLDRRTFRELS